MSFQEYLELINSKYTQAEASTDYDEAIRLLALLRDTCVEQIAKLHNAAAKKA